MATLLKAARITDLGVRRTRPFPRKEVGQRDLTIDPLPFHMIDESGFIMTFRATDVLVGRGPPGLHVGIHLVTEPAKRRGLRKPQKTCNDDNKNNDAGNEENLDCFEVRLSSSFRLIEKIDPENLDQKVKILYSSHRRPPPKA
jgi:hypothetical protein